MMFPQVLPACDVFVESSFLLAHLVCDSRSADCDSNVSVPPGQPVIATAG
jgi:hypothetical protein